MTNSLQAHTKSDKQFQIRSDLNLMTISLQTDSKTPSKLKLGDQKFAHWLETKELSFTFNFVFKDLVHSFCKAFFHLDYKIYYISYLFLSLAYLSVLFQETIGLDIFIFFKI
jgi:hypothetical protein